MSVVKPVRSGYSPGPGRRRFGLPGEPATGDQGTTRLPVLHVRCHAACVYLDGAMEWHHDRLTAIEHDQDAVLELMELAVTWPELEHSEACTIPPASWEAFRESHRWQDPQRVERVFSLATDIVRTAERASRQRLELSGCDLGPR